MRVSAADVIRQVLKENDLEFTESEEGAFAASFGSLLASIAF